MNDLQEIFKEIAENWGYETVEAMKKKLRGYKPYPSVDTNRLISSINYNVSDSLEVKFSMADYGRFIDEATGPNNYINPRPFKAGYAKKLGAILQPWATRKGINPWAAAKSIVKKGGLKPRKFYTSVIESRVGDGSFEKAMEQGLKLYEESLAKEFNKQ